jgi:hypothetical protein
MDVFSISFSLGLASLCHRSAVITVVMALTVPILWLTTAAISGEFHIQSLALSIIGFNSAVATVITGAALAASRRIKT